jgi:hypothetical protein
VTTDTRSGVRGWRQRDAELESRIEAAWEDFVEAVRRDKEGPVGRWAQYRLACRRRQEHATEAANAAASAGGDIPVRVSVPGPGMEDLGDGLRHAVRQVVEELLDAD